MQCILIYTCNAGVLDMLHELIQTKMYNMRPALRKGPSAEIVVYTRESPTFSVKSYNWLSVNMYDLYRYEYKAENSTLHCRVHPTYCALK